MLDKFFHKWSFCCKIFCSNKLRLRFEAWHSRFCESINLCNKKCWSFWSRTLKASWELSLNVLFILEQLFLWLRDGFNGERTESKIVLFVFHLGVNKVLYKIIYGNFDIFISQWMMCSRKPKLLLLLFFLERKLGTNQGLKWEILCPVW